MSSIDPRAIIAEVLGGEVDMDPPPREMSPDLMPWHVLFEKGHNIVTAVDTGDLDEDPSIDTLTGMLLPAPVKTVERVGWRVVKGFVVASLPYDPKLGLVAPQEDEEYIDAAAAPHDDPPITVLTVGQPYPVRLPWQSGGTQITITAQGVDFVLPLSAPSAAEVRAFGKGNAEFAILSEVILGSSTASGT